ncbi:tetratricopeptide repeat protein [Rubinisphaera margarita]|uniref:tetratricopeptide repeat protein n=1 Tax=Rubinisphaera margarita TaxID=2909586 RepID=UPI001EE83201|nr:tetratricopeptide repeat protein [Rubinisphaera margarita]MCG6156964.1 tetratricopeptide repeat protein [Rubinisphaera margarita]
MSGVEDIARQCWQRGSKAVSNEDYDYAVEMFHKAAVLVPDNLAYRQSLRGAEFKKYGNNGKGAGAMSKPRLMGLRSKLSRARSKGEWDEVDKIAEEALKLSPWDAGFNAAVGEACKARGYNHVAIFAYQTAVGPTGEPDNIKLQREFAQLLQDDRKFTEAANVWNRVMKLDPQDSIARQNKTACHFEATIKTGGFDDAESMEDVKMTDAKVAEKLGLKGKRPGDADAPGQDPEKDLMHQIRKDPNSVELHQKLAQFYESKGQLKEAQEALQKALELSKGDRNIQELIDELELKQMSFQLDRLKLAASNAPDDEEAQKKASRFARKLLDREIEIYEVLVQRYPQNKQHKYQLARRYKVLKRWSDAIPLYQQASQDPRLEVDSLVSLGNCFLKDNKPTLAKKQFLKVVPLISFEDYPDRFKEVHYWIGRILEKEGDLKAAEDHYGEILAVDYDYRDVRDRLNGLAET